MNFDRSNGDIGSAFHHCEVSFCVERPDGPINTDLTPDLLHPNLAGAEAWGSSHRANPDEADGRQTDHGSQDRSLKLSVTESAF